jgi:hypothetical protein
MQVEPFNDAFQQFRRIPAVIVGDSDDIPLRGWQSHVPSGRYSQPIGAKISLPNGMPLQELLHVIARVLIDQQDLEIAASLAVQVCQESIQLLDAITRGDDERDPGVLARS